MRVRSDLPAGVRLRHAHVQQQLRVRMPGQPRQAARPGLVHHKERQMQRVFLISRKISLVMFSILLCALVTSLPLWDGWAEHECLCMRPYDPICASDMQRILMSAGAQVFPMNGIGILGNADLPRGPSADWWVPTA
ncbi:hypothetical protein evm_007353 [Chilo suppressalis]|nr:hypothetical protein evm_007353 [Chilo suppressalis]